mmetsp:Transcript_47573/g.121408  ORF Transcript_47573/g.121408 Transcript_47573/m.121408 type:complete len:315 (-) Transcript_47573:358-1302(-)
MAGIVFKRLCCCFDSDDVHTQQCALAMLRLVWQIQDVLSAVIIADCEADSVSTPREQSLRGAVLVHPLASLPPKQPGVDILCQKWARAVLGVAQSAVQDAHYGQACIQPDEVGQGKRAHWLVGAQLHAHVDVFRRRDALHQRKEGLVNHRHQDAVHHEARPIRRHADLLAHALRQGARCSVCLFVSVHPADDFDQAHQRRRVHPVHPHLRVWSAIAAVLPPWRGTCLLRKQWCAGRGSVGRGQAARANAPLSPAVRLWPPGALSRWSLCLWQGCSVAGPPDQGSERWTASAALSRWRPPPQSPLPPGPGAPSAG